ncbi:uncharacterized protein FOMMEDRAFT_27803 [Fomitiporia mediterranea MF3/22]|uniref:uncharacterized protein n=1 Tax=Fomitiporia mediterranea (strain MF3/22) TaxID=694068 RepID=UPI0004409C06|nr:uncharacterized protein FOMMEDRAFT_27803 [Fomitiporia mediterranea MF3/22]EJD03980.1 hypothetical protein FOMMEDRAFT_27803 [Fomitiporia mediterranea MF3/22]
MANDPGRQLLEDQIQTSGFLFLEDYLENILARPRHDAIFEFVKTPARRKDVSKRAKTATTAPSKAKSIITMDLDDEDSDKENAPAVKPATSNAFHKALLQAKGANSTKLQEQSSRNASAKADCVYPVKPTSSKKESGKKTTVVPVLSAPLADVLTDEEEEKEGEITEEGVTSHSAIPSSQAHESSSAASIMPVDSADQQEPPDERITQLSVIAEDDEPPVHTTSSTDKPSADASAAANHSSSKNERSSKPRLKRSPPKIDMTAVMDIDDITQTTNFTMTSASTQSLQTAPLDPLAPAPPSISEPFSQMQVSDAASVQPDSLNAQSSTSQDREHTSAPLPINETGSEALQQSQPTEASAVQMANVSEFPTIGPPSPLRKSMRAPREPLTAKAHVPPTTKSAGTRSSWLVKAREAKAQEDNAKKLNPLPIFSHQPATGSKRKSGEMLDNEPGGILEHGDAGHTQKLTKIIETSPVLSMLKNKGKHPFGSLQDEADAVANNEAHEVEGSDGMINKLKKTVAGFSARAGKSMGKSLGGAAATALAEARAAAEAKIAERHAAEGRTFPIPPTAASHEPDGSTSTAPALAPAADEQASLNQMETAQTHPSNEKDRRLSVSDLVTKQDSKRVEHARVFKPPAKQPLEAAATSGKNKVEADTSTSTTPPNSPPKVRVPAFTVPDKPKLPPLPAFFPPPPNQVFTRLEPEPFAPRIAQPLSSQSTLFSTQSVFADPIFDHEIPPWVPSTQDTDFCDHLPSQNAATKDDHCEVTEPETDIEADESWHLDEKFGETWTPVAIRMNDSVTWSTAPSRSTRSADTGPLDASTAPSRLQSSSTQDFQEGNNRVFDAIPSDNPPATTTDEIEEDDMDVEPDEDIASIRLVTPITQPSTGSSSALPGTALSQNNQAGTNSTGGFFSSASRLVSSVLGGSKKGKEPVKSLQLAAAAAKKQEEAERKANRLKEMEARRQQVLQKKAEEDRAREVKKARDETERWKREREKEETTEKKIFKQLGKKFEDEAAKKRKVAETDKKTEPKPPKDKKDGPMSKLSKFVPASSQSGPNVSGVTPGAAPKPVKQGTSVAMQGSTVKAPGAPNDTKLPLASKAKEKSKELDVRQPSQTAQSHQMKTQTRLQAYPEDSRRTESPPPQVPTESIELPDINSEYSNSDDENRVRTFDPPEWAQSPELREALQSQSTVNPDDIFGAIRPLKMEELFKNRTSRFRARTSSANWAGPDGLTIQEEREYARRMGYKK